MKILHLISSGGMYGAEAVILSLCRSLNTGQDRSEVVVFGNLPYPNLELHSAAQNAGIVSRVLECAGPLDRSVLPALRNLVLESGADIVHAHGYKADVYAWLALRSSTIPLVSTCHTWYDNDLPARMYGALDRLVLRRYDAVVAVSREVEERLTRAGVSPKKVILIRNGIDAAPFQHIQRRDTEEPLAIGLAGRLTKEKGIDLFLGAAHSVLQVLPRTSFLIAGDGPDKEELHDLVQDLGIEANVSFLGRCNDMPAFYASLDLLVSSSRQEGLPIGLLEAMASGLPIIASGVGEVPVIIRDGQTGVLVPPGDVPALAHAILHLLQDPQARASYGRAARTLVAQEFSASAMAANYRALYAACLKPKHGAS